MWWKGLCGGVFGIPTTVNCKSLSATMNLANLRTSNKNSILDKTLTTKGKNEVSLSLFALVFSEIIQYSQKSCSSVADLSEKIHSLGYDVGSRLLDLYVFREKSSKRETKLINMLLFIKTTLWKTLFGKEIDKLEHANDDERTYYIIETDPVVNKYISVPKDKGSLNPAIFTAGIIEAVLTLSGFTCKVTAHYHKGTTYMCKFEDFVISRDKLLD